MISERMDRILGRIIEATLTMLTLAVVIVVVLLAPAAAQDTTVSVDSLLEPLRPYLVEMVTVIGIAVTGWLVTWLRTLFGLQVEEKHRQALQSALENAGRLAIGYAEGKLEDKSIDVKNQAIKRGIDYVLDSVPDAVKYFDLGPEQVRDKLLPKIMPKP